MDDSRAYNIRQYELMLKTLQDYRNRKISLERLINNLDALRGVLQVPPISWLDSFEPQWGKLEDVHAMMLDEERTELDELDLKLIESALAELEPLIKSEIAHQSVL